ncbi:site-specific recombinase XerD [Azospirillum brasilense]|uniref:Site-specific recombinase XerD n=1 Tax=Azospirillum brasilense TaxID=192 RepID=A0A560BWU8_AZOBR|nr:site-specific integrase [Azospirillum brasilense]TWA77091.1 site-specific recombinase XerD [Azospirillum brasilense]
MPQDTPDDPIPRLFPDGTGAAWPAPDAGVAVETGIFGRLVVPADPARAAEIQDLARQAAVWATRARGEGTLRAYRSAWTAYGAWCERLGFAPLTGDAEIIGMYLVKAAERLTVPTLRVHLAAIATAHRLAGVPVDLKHPRIALVLDGLARGQADRPIRQAAPILLDVLPRLLVAQPDGPLGLRNRAMLLIGYGAALRRSELVALRVADVTRHPDRGVEVTVRRSKTDQRGRGDAVAIWAAADPDLCALRALDAWLAVRGALRPEDPLFCGVLKNGAVTGKPLSDKAVARLVKESAVRAGLPEPERFSSHSLRAGLATAAAEEEAQLHDIMRQTRHKSTEVARRYLRSRDRWRNNVTEKLFRSRGGGGS